MSKETTFSGIHTREDDLLVTAARLLRLWRELFGQNISTHTLRMEGDKKPFSPSTDQSVDEKSL
ncbi:hypothetical protein [uncultured Agathobaculum sp.]|uniref:hypothetical protein n=1 Tax=uncultured Agathobaculum sp. TaxID=2048140 RepID=UPI003208736A